MYKRQGIGSSVVVPDNDAIRGMVRQVRFLVTVEEIEEAGAATNRSKDRSEAPAGQQSEDSQEKA